MIGKGGRIVVPLFSLNKAGKAREILTLPAFSVSFPASRN